MAMAMLARRSRNIPRIVCNFTNIKHLFRKPKFQTVETQNRYSLNRLAALSSFCVKCDSQLPLKYGHTHIRGLHTSLLLRNELKTVVCPNFAESITEGDIKWEKAVGDAVKVDETIAEVETAKTSIKVPSPVAGVIDSLLVKEGETISPGANICTIRVGDEAKLVAPQPSAAATQKEAKPVTPQPVEQPAAISAGPIPTAPPSAPPLPKVPISSISKSQVQPKVAAMPKPSASGAVVPKPSAGAASFGETRSESRVKMNRMRLRIAERLKDAQNTCAMLTTFNEVDMSNIMDMRTKYKDAFQKKHGLKLGFMSAFIKASAYALHGQPIVNAVIDDTDILYRDYIDISVAVATPKGLVVPVIRNVEKMNYADIEKTINALGEKARTGDLAIEDMDGGTFTISNGGVFGSMFGTPIINPPQSAILGMHGIFDRPVAVNGKVEIRPMMYVALTYDHRLIDGREAVTFLKKIKSSVEDPREMLLDL